MKKTEQFADYGQLGRGKPYLTLTTTAKTGRAHWTCGDMRDYNEFRLAVDSERMSKMLTLVFRGEVPESRRKAVLSHGSVIGSVNHVPPDVAEAIFEIVRGYFNAGLDAMVAAGVASPARFTDGEDPLFRRLSERKELRDAAYREYEAA
jgi:hypothetical protein